MVLIVVLVIMFLSGQGTGGTVGVESVCENGKCLVRAASSTLSTILSPVLVLFVIFYPQARDELDETKFVKIWQRFLAFILDFMVVLLALTPILALPILLIEGRMTGSFEWSFSREFARDTDALAILPGILLAFVALFLYFYLHAKAGKATLGQYVLGYKVTGLADASRKPNYFARTMLSFVGMSMWPISWFLAAKNPDRKFWWDDASNSRAVRTRQTGKS
ncbi:MAG: hypothetical protein CMI63_09355 [Parvularcula sp.]|nr:hypothetical protein [Parvularcula sp.]